MTRSAVHPDFNHPDLLAREAREAVIRERLAAANPGMRWITIHIMAGDLRQAEDARAMFDRGEITASKALTYTGSYARWDFAHALWSEGHLTDTEYFGDLCDLWSGSDPDDTDPRWLAIWQQARRSLNVAYIREGAPLPRKRWITVYRGEQPGDKPGIAWSLDPKVARKFALGAGARTTYPMGVVIKGTVLRENVLAYIDGRNEAEVILDPATVSILTRRKVYP
jgi:hypothetical protein